MMLGDTLYDAGRYTAWCWEHEIHCMMRDALHAGRYTV